MLRLIIRLARWAITLRSMTRAGPPTAGGGGLWLQPAPVSERLAPDEPHGFGQAGVAYSPFLEGVDGPADSGERSPVLARHGSHLNRRASAAQHGAYGVVAEPLLHSGRELPQLRGFPAAPARVPRIVSFMSCWRWVNIASVCCPSLAIMVIAC